MRFYDRKTELELLSELSKRAEQFAQFTSIIGRRRVGKTELVRQHLIKQPPTPFIKGDNPIPDLVVR